MVFAPLHTSLRELVDLLRQLSDADYAAPCPELSHSSIGEHTRHIIELFQCLQQQYESGILNYDVRERNQHIQTNTDFAITTIHQIQLNLEQPNKELQLNQNIAGELVQIQTNYYRELVYNLEHCVHHQALIKVALLQHHQVQIAENFGVASATIEYRKQCAQ